MTLTDLRMRISSASNHSRGVFGYCLDQPGGGDCAQILARPSCSSHHQLRLARAVKSVRQNATVKCRFDLPPKHRTKLTTNERGRETCAQANTPRRGHRRCSANRCRLQGGGLGAADRSLSTYTICGWKARYGGMDVTSRRNHANFGRKARCSNQPLADIRRDKDAVQSMIRKSGWRSQV
jgi:hypothetical protein